MQRYSVAVNFTTEPDSTISAAAAEAAKAVLFDQNISEPASLNVLIANDDYLRELNKNYRGYDQPTDVLAFPMDAEVSGLEGHIGDLAISLETANKQAEKADHSTASEIRLLVVHGTLHLLGYNHADEKEKGEMWAVQGRVLKQLDPEVLHPI